MLWDAIFWWNKETVGGCRPQQLVPYLEDAGFHVHERHVIQGDRKSFLGYMNNEVIVAKPGKVAQRDSE